MKQITQPIIPLFPLRNNRKGMRLSQFANEWSKYRHPHLSQKKNGCVGEGEGSNFPTFITSTHKHIKFEIL